MYRLRELGRVDVLRARKHYLASYADTDVNGFVFTWRLITTSTVLVPTGVNTSSSPLLGALEVLSPNRRPRSSKTASDLYLGRFPARRSVCFAMPYDGYFRMLWRYVHSATHPLV